MHLPACLYDLVHVLSQRTMPKRVLETEFNCLGTRKWEVVISQGYIKKIQFAAGSLLGQIKG